MERPELLRPAGAAQRYSLSRRTLARLMRNDPNFPKPIRLSKRMILLERQAMDRYFDSKRQQPSARETAHA